MFQSKKASLVQDKLVAYPFYMLKMNLVADFVYIH